MALLLVGYVMEEARREGDVHAPILERQMERRAHAERGLPLREILAHELQHLERNVHLQKSFSERLERLEEPARSAGQVEDQVVSAVGQLEALLDDRVFALRADALVPLLVVLHVERGGTLVAFVPLDDFLFHGRRDSNKCPRRVPA